MFHQFVIFVSITVGCCCLVNATFDSKGYDEKSNAMRVQNILAANPKIDVVGSYDKKVYFTTTSNMNQADAQEYCRNNSMVLLTVMNTGELNYLFSLTTGTDTRYWTSGKDMNVYNWEDGNGDTVDFPISIKHQLCVVLYLNSLFSDPCNGELGFIYYPLCELTQD